MSLKAEVKPHAEEQPWMPLVNRNLPLVKYVMGKLSSNLPPCVDRDDLLAAGSLGLTEAARRYDPSRNVPFHSYAIPRIWGAMLDELRSRDWLSSDMRGQVTRLQESLARFRQDGRLSPTAEELAEDLGCKAERVTRLLSISRADQKGADVQTADAKDGGLRARLGVRSPRTPYEEAEFRDQKRVLAEAIQLLPEREKQVILLRYHEELFLHEIGKLMKVSESRVCQIHGQALRRLKQALSRAGLGVT
jgi:RNA polymerase sigma factor for flagellar operon FliA